ncbi:MAG: hypothetical protein JSW53_04940 [Candidatus Bathyarchaeota archaeon]|nr:MAG: hypothetical protein JSW53_04940 [Candidatus Bathyarchaeota archaeon]
MRKILIFALCLIGVALILAPSVAAGSQFSMTVQLTDDFGYLWTLTVKKHAIVWYLYGTVFTDVGTFLARGFAQSPEMVLWCNGPGDPSADSFAYIGRWDVKAKTFDGVFISYMDGTSWYGNVSMGIAVSEIESEMSPLTPLATYARGGGMTPGGLDFDIQSNLQLTGTTIFEDSWAYIWDLNEVMYQGHVYYGRTSAMDGSPAFGFRDRSEMFLWANGPGGDTGYVDSFVYIGKWIEVNLFDGAWINYYNGDMVATGMVTLWEI